MMRLSRLLNRNNRVELMDHPESWIKICGRRTTRQLFESLSRLDQRQSWSLAAILAHLAELDKRRAVEAEGYPSLFVYCTRKLGNSEAEAYLRIRTARAARIYPRILTMIACGRLHLTTAARLAPHLDSGNYRRLLDRASRRTKEEVDRLIAELAPLPEKRPIIRTLSVGNDKAVLSDELALMKRAEGDVEGERSKSSLPESREGQVEGRVLFDFAAGESLRGMFNRARELLRHKYPQGLPEDVFREALEALLDRKDPDRRLARSAKRSVKRRSGRAG